METPSDTSKILEKGPEYLRKQMELESEVKGPMSAVERLAASKPKYVKSQQAGDSAQRSPSGPASNSSASNVSSDRTSTRVRVSRRSASPVQVRRASSKKRPDSVLLYRQKCELLRAPGSDRKHHITRKLLRSSAKKTTALPEAADKECEPRSGEEDLVTPEESAKEYCPSARTPTLERGPNGAAKLLESGPKELSANLLKVPTGRGKGVARSRSDVSSRYSKNFADFDAFFRYCGLDGEVIESLGKENFSARSDETAIKLRSVSVTASDGGFSRDSDDSDGLQEDVLRKKIRQGTSVIERNARIIKWLYSCKNAKESGKKLRDLD
ncbi:protein FAM110C [Syngnathoides biaculeatus]|uniref:protein FAM110C n=1 Tax=Syngnathoides biaculeatus TaxID=300417 RepID=UPI002ADDB2B3|nr:protein FAM110C [Syngnathoides biaculeatus]XP_061667500.1 protein FAM110C [Syngnathoides biaculeatus]XP_061667501.1 protein FAM110C [Syngnathoides biaculeatus]XP_061667502.1 protein FAM110C [Syngnathoides biaculeatus]XP_061667503.1 protein FAM110C [Syngnathoides biaculeatus]XP_061667504.1 protein FAM110C [Syngnathoides biaculeatus]XP_061667505.1 protein FAM110C [Syngnathoides biaculeatus]XP_061667506.1 protein FAM110C [Syngnathoides biaculeatus]